MPIVTEGEASRRIDRARFSARVLVVSAAVLFVAAGGLLWWRHGATVFSDMVLAGIAWCF